MGYVRLLPRKSRNVECLSVLGTETADLFKLTWRWCLHKSHSYYLNTSSDVLYSEGSFSVSPGSLAKSHMTTSIWALYWSASCIGRTFHSYQFCSDSLSDCGTCTKVLSFCYEFDSLGTTVCVNDMKGLFFI